MNHSDAALDALLARAEAGVHQAVADNLDTDRGCSLVHWHAVPTEDVPLPSPPDPYAAYQNIHIHGALTASTKSEQTPGSLTCHPSPAAGRTLAQLVADAYRNTELLEDILTLSATTDDTYLLRDQLEVRITYLHGRFVENGLGNGKGMNGSRAAHLTLAVWGSACRIRRRLEEGEDFALAPGARMRAVSLCSGIITAMETIRDSLFILFGIEVTAVMT
ncbi:hypothetical protein B7755_007160 [Streptomyces sp. NBS 14/10]|uniref:hypothetical protein n=1 Tax=Streptomyces sp. NBS 14/10 TaxID=1945643 RepID=UPI000B7D12F5|nr:hypothetical protein [Streptomyces sp. NBS 14/10]KAK1177950.1 hypothetical protein B7755_007160 [Streptomyces sp. NBS 14/10]